MSDHERLDGVVLDHGPCTSWHELFPQIRNEDHCRCPDGLHCTVYPAPTPIPPRHRDGYADTDRDRPDPNDNTYDAKDDA